MEEGLNLDNIMSEEEIVGSSLISLVMSTQKKKLILNLRVVQTKIQQNKLPRKKSMQSVCLILIRRA